LREDPERRKAGGFTRVEFPAKLVMSLNLKTAQALGLQLPQELLNIADRVVE
jgi:hypothetical protein